jgi:hypothetical protein
MERRATARGAPHSAFASPPSTPKPSRVPSHKVASMTVPKEEADEEGEKREREK